MDIFNEVSKARKILNIIFGVILIVISVAVVYFLVQYLIPLIKRTPYQLLDPDMTIRNELSHDWFFQFLGWFFVYVVFRSGISFFKDSIKCYCLIKPIEVRSVEIKNATRNSQLE